MNGLRQKLRFPYLPIWLAAFILLAPVYLSLKALFWGTPLLQFAPWWSFAWRTLLSGHLPLWNPLSGMGAPLLANYQSGLLYPPYWIYLLLYALGGDRLMAWGMAPLAALHLAWAGLGMALLARRLGLSEVSQAVSGLAFGLSGYLVARLGFLSINAACAWLPWVLFLLTPRPGARFPRRGDFPWLVVCLAMLLLSGHAQTAWYTLLLAALWVGFWAWKGREDSAVEGQISGRAPWARARRLAAGWLVFGFALILAAGISAAQLLPTAEYLAQSQRSAAVEYAFALNYSFWPWHLLTLLAPTLFGTPAFGDYWLYSSYWEDAVYVGLLPLLLACTALAGSLRARKQPDGRRSLVWFLALLSLVALALALGSNTPLFPWLYRNVPTFAMFQAPARWMIWAEFALALLAGLGADRWRRPQGWGLYWTRLATMGAMAISLGAGLAWLYLGAVSPSFIRAAAILGFLGVGAGFLSQFAPPAENPPPLPPVKDAPQKTGLRRLLVQFTPPQPKPRPPDKPYPLKTWQWAVAVFVAVDLLAAGWGLNPGVDLDVYGAAPGGADLSEALAGRRLYLHQAQEDWLKYVRFMRFNTFDIGEDWINLRAVMLPNVAMLDGIASTGNFDPLVPGRFAEWKRLLLEVPPAVHDDLLRLMGVGVVESLARRSPDGVRFTPLDGARLRLIGCGLPVVNAEASRARMAAGGVDFERQVVLEGLPAGMEACPPGQEDASAPLGEARLAPGDANPNVVRIQSDARQPAWLVVSDVWYPGWRAWLDGQPVPLYRADYLFMAVRVPQGEHQLVIAYRPLSFYAGAAVSLFSILLLAWTWLRIRRGTWNDFGVR